MRRVSLPVTLWIYSLALLAGAPAAAQEHDALEPVTDSYAIRNVTIVPAPGRVIERGTIIIRNGLIDAVGVDLPIPPRAVIVDGDSLYAYAAFIEGLSYTGVTGSDDEAHERVQDPGNPPPAQAGINPQRDVRDYLDPGDRSIRELRCAGFGAAQVVPRGIFLPGAAALILLSGNTPDQMVIKPRSACYSDLRPNKAVYPSTVMALMAKWRELYRQATLARDYSDIYASGSRGLPRPTSNRVLESLYPVTSADQPVLFRARSVLDVQRVLALQKELGFLLVLGDVREGWDLTGKIRDSGAKVFLALDLPEDPGEQEKSGEGEEKKDTLTDPEIGVLKARRTSFIGRMVSQAVAFDEAGIKFGFSVLDARHGDIHQNLYRMLEAGLKPERALAALTVDAAELLGVGDRLGTIDAGKIANVVLFDRPMFEEDARVTTVFVDGRLYTCEDKKTHKKSAAATIEGSWSFMAPTPHENIDLKVVFRKSPDSQWSGSITGSRLPKATGLNSVSLKGTSLTFSYDVIFDGKPYEVMIDGHLDGEKFEGNMSLGEFGQFPVEGVKDPKQ